jgi:hypothetical protein
MGEAFETIQNIWHLYRPRTYRMLRADRHNFMPIDAKVLDFFTRHPGATPRHHAISLRRGQHKAHTSRA